MDELEISGKRYISTRRAAREHGYHSDYMGQLIRGKKVAGQKVGRAWYIEEESLNAYLGNAPTPAPAPKVADAPAPTPGVERLVVEEPVLAPEPELAPADEPALQEAAVAVGGAQEVEEIKEDEQPVAVRIAQEAAPEPAHKPAPLAAKEIHHTPYIEEERRVPLHTQAPVLQQTGGLRYTADDAPVIPVVTRMPQAYAQAPAQYAHTQLARSADKFPYASLVVIAVISLTAAAFASNFVTATIATGEGATAIVQYAIHW